jgi:glycosyltransferase involved in cell wall biosynthesis
MKVLMITPSYAPIVGGTETVVSHLSRELVEQGHELAILTFNMKQKWRPSWKMEVTYDQGIRVIKWPALSPVGLRSPARIRKLFRKDPVAFAASLPVKICNAHVLPRLGLPQLMSNYDILHFHDAVDLSFLLFSGSPPWKTIFHCHTLNETIDRYRSSSFSRRLLNRKAGFHICDSISTRALLINLGLPPERSTVLPNGVDTAVFKPGNNRSEDRLILFVGRVDEKRKGLHVLLQALSLIAMSVHLVVAGPLGNPVNLEAVLAHMREGSRGRHTLDYLGCIQEHELVLWMQKAAVFVFPSLSEAFGIVGVEAMACGAPVVASNTGGIPDFITHNETGILVPPGNPRELAGAIERLLENKPLRFRIAKQGYNYVTKHLTWEKVAARLDNIYQYVLGMASRPDSN